MVQSFTPSAHSLRTTFVLAALLLGACSSARRPPQVVRRLEGELRTGAFVPAYAYEWYTRGELALLKGAPDEAAEAFRNALTAPTVDPYVLSRYALAASRAGADARARDALAEAEAISPCLPELWVVRGELADAAGEPARAIGAYRRAVDCQPTHAAARRALVAALTRAGAEARALSVAHARPDPASVSCAVAQCAAASLAERQIELRDALARGDTETVRRLLPSDPALSPLPPALLAEALGALGEHERAARVWSSAAPLATEQLPLAAQAYLRAGQLDAARLAAEAVLSEQVSAPPRQRAESVLARVEHAEGNPLQALQSLPVQDRDTLRAWLEEAGLSGLAAELARLGQAQ